MIAAGTTKTMPIAVDESTFRNNGLVNRHNFRYYSDSQHRWFVNVWGGIIRSLVIGPYFFDGHLVLCFFGLSQAVYMNLLLNIRQRTCLQLDDAPVYYDSNLRRIEQTLS
nr:unnamed protein product [Callosobruchus chinensis]